MNLLETLKHYFGYDSLRPGQQELMDGILQGKDVLGIMPTGAGKSLCYQVPALMLEGITLVISPLISLMSDQVKALNQAGVHAAYINSSLTENQIRVALAYAAQGKYKIIYVAPERLNTARFLDFAYYADISMVTVDEAHCISQWGQDFRPSYLEIADFLAKLPDRPMVSAFTATATERVKQDITASLHLQNPVTVVTGFDRPNLFFRVVNRKGGKETDNSILNYVKRHEDESGIIYCATKKNVDSVYALLLQYGIAAGRYHAGLSLEERKKNQDDFTYDRIRVMVATNAFGMGIDKSNVRYVLHYNMPQSLEYYYQEAGNFSYRQSSTNRYNTVITDLCKLFDSLCLHIPECLFTGIPEYILNKLVILILYILVSIKKFHIVSPGNPSSKCCLTASHKTNKDNIILSIH